MANEISVSTRITLSNGSLKETFAPGLVQIDQTNGRIFSQVYDVGTTEESITSFGDITTPGLITLVNLDATNFVEWGLATTDRDLKLTPGMHAVVQGSANFQLFWKADTATCKCWLIVRDA